MTNPTRNQRQNQDKDARARGQGQQSHAQGRKDDMHDTGAQAKGNQDARDSDRDVQRRDASKQDQHH